MRTPQMKSTGRDHAPTAALLAAGLIFIPAVVLASSPVGYVPLAFATACSAMCGTLAWLNWRRYSELTIPSIEAPARKVK